ncbi:LysR substrate-binding domain-containing protein [Rhodoplanes sp. TEM]|uniref:LysR substrate-binding domain-containing protein n=1 Tax=Rhodoplanes tepidamans TaxID=200616 RepID=A0ABT5JJH7_RHOTP|nr:MULTISPECIES: LysR family transcriptional regulator [Rhodoplanes]MDC7789868.1 LysR substrate-binding domain-containing protein [Rhodoplanes tepidamans]MDC7984867.1 LysR substrate-binding domain-containing protein [Rhodoplanes sp. TEM]MDQ0358456.1 DNA-binding transcriptional LysR family regulator [Rhodoplanes tepidamans]
MQQTNLRAVDLNLLVVLDALAAERSVTRAAARLHLTQPAVSHALARLRALFGDPLFVRTPAGLSPTAAALRLAPRVAAVLAEIGGLLAPGERFDPATARRRFTLGMSDYAAFVVLPALAAALRAQAPRVELVVRHTSHASGFALLEDGGAELIVGHFPKPPARIVQAPLFAETFLCAARKDHPAFARRLTAARWAALDHLQVSLSGEPSGMVDEALRRKGVRRRVVTTVGHFLVAPEILAATDLVATEPARVLGPLAARLGLATRPPPVPLPGFAVVQAWPRRLTADDGLAWLRRAVAAAAA